MADISLTTSNVTFTLGIIGIIFSVYHYFRNPQESIEKKQIISENELGNKASILAQKEMENKASLLDQQVKIERDSNEKKFSEMGTRLDQAFTLAQNHIHTVDVKTDTLSTSINEMNFRLTNEIVKLGTILAERLPPKQ